MLRRSWVRAFAAVGSAAVLGVSACSGAPTAPSGPPAPARSPKEATPAATEPARVTVAFIEAADLEPPGDRIAPAFQGAKLAFATAEILGDLPVEVEIRTVDTDGDVPGTLAVAAEIAAETAIVAAIAAPGLPWQTALGDALSAAGVPWISLSGSGTGLGERGWSGWRRLVADHTAEGRALGRVLRRTPGAGRGLCVLDRSAPVGRLLDAAVAASGATVRLRASVEDSATGIAAAVTAVERAGCGVVVWGGEGALGAVLRRRLLEAGLGRTRFVGTDRIRDAGYLEAAGAAAEGTVAVCPCVNVSTSTELASQRFIQDFQAEFGLAPGTCAVEGWDAARLLISLFRTGAVERSSIREALGAVTSFEGLARRYRFRPGGDLAQPIGAVRTYRVEGGRWLEVSGDLRR